MNKAKSKPKIIRITTVPVSLAVLLKGQLRFMSEYFEVIGVSSGGKALEEVAIQESIRVKEINMTRKISPFKDLVSLIKMILFFLKEKPQIVHTHTPKAGIIGMLAAYITRVPHRLHTVAGMPLMEAKGNKRRLLDFVEKLTYVCATKVYPNSKKMCDFINNNDYCSKNKVKVIAEGSSNGIDTKHFSRANFQQEGLFELRKKLNICDDDFVFVFVGRLVGDKGINELVEAFVEVNETQKNTKLLLVGPEEKELDPLKGKNIQHIANNNDIIAVGHQADVRPFLAISNCLTFPSYREGFPNVVMQAGAMGLPSIVTDINGCNEIIINNVNGQIIPSKDKLALYESMNFFYENRNGDVVNMANNSRELISNRYEQNIIWNSLLEEYNNLLIK